MTDPRVRRAALADAEAICHVHHASVRSLCAAAYTPADIEAWVGWRTPANYKVLIRGTVFLVAEVGEGVAGFGVLSVGGGGELHALYVHPDHVGRGVGSALLAALEAEACRAGLAGIALNATLNSVSFYARHGYASRGATTNVLPNGVALPCVRMDRRLAVGSDAARSP
jgi:putative acetyltransferase